jgi:hypothetical protein
VVVVGGLAAAGSPVRAEIETAVTTPVAVPFDFDGDGYADLAVGAQGEDVGSIRDAGIVQVLYGSAAGPTARDQIWQQNNKGIKGKAEREDQFGQVTASGDFDGDGFADLAIGIPGEDLGGRCCTAVRVGSRPETSCGIRGSPGCRVRTRPETCSA